MKRGAIALNWWADKDRWWRCAWPISLATLEAQSGSARQEAQQVIALADTPERLDEPGYFTRKKGQLTARAVTGQMSASRSVPELMPILSKKHRNQKLERQRTASARIEAQLEAETPMTMPGVYRPLGRLRLNLTAQLTERWYFVGLIHRGWRTRNGLITIILRLWIPRLTSAWYAGYLLFARW